jgi:hypothetical protein
MPTSDTTSPSLRAQAKAGSGMRWNSSNTAVSRFIVQTSMIAMAIVFHTALWSGVLML